MLVKGVYFFEKLIHSTLDPKINVFIRQFYGQNLLLNKSERFIVGGYFLMSSKNRMKFFLRLFSSIVYEVYFVYSSRIIEIHGFNFVPRPQRSYKVLQLSRLKVRISLVFAKLARSRLFQCTQTKIKKEAIEGVQS